MAFRNLRTLSTVAILMTSPVAVGQEQSLSERIDQHVIQGWAAQKIAPAQASDDASFLRRVYLDLIGTIPTYEETRTFLADASPDKRSKLIDRLLDDPRYAEQQADMWEDVLISRTPLNPEASRSRSGFQKWLRARFAANAPLNGWVKDVLLAEGNSQDEGPPLFYAQFRAQPEETAVAVTRIFLGTQLACAQCHDHPYDSWKQRDFYGMAAFFARLVMIDAGGGMNNKKFVIGERRTGEVLFTGPAIEQKPGQKGEPVYAKFLDGKALVEPPLPKGFQEPAKKGAVKSLPKPDFSRKEKLAEWLTAAENPYFAKAMVNRLWGQFLRRGIVHPVDNLSENNKASHAELLDLLAREFVAHKFDIKWLIRELVNSKTYQLSSSGSAGEPRWFEQMQLRPLTDAEMIHALRVAAGWGSDKLPANLDGQIQRVFGNAVDGRGEFQASLAERLFVSNSQNFRAVITKKPGALWHRLHFAKEPVPERVDQLFLSVLSRPPEAEERTRFAAHLSRGTIATSDTTVEDAIWALLASAEFRFNH
jgi:hypothetical protein